ncbi:MAG: hypothetical protein ACFFHD_16350, partial [Promethearchaeota archaeon]
MERDLKKDLGKILKKEKFQGKMVSYMSKIGKLLLFILPIVLVIITILALIWKLDINNITLIIVFFAVLSVYFFNSVMLLLGANSTESSLKLRLNF